MNNIEILMDTGTILHLLHGGHSNYLDPSDTIYVRFFFF
jgi:hypothetical protein